VLHAHKKIDEIKELPENWNGYGSSGIDEGILKSVLSLLEKLKNTRDIKLSIPFVCPVSGGGIQFEWSLGCKHLELEFSDNDTIVFLKEETVNDIPQMSSGEISANDMNEICLLLEWLIKE
jgi:hypothetical protein